MNGERKKWPGPDAGPVVCMGCGCPDLRLVASRPMGKRVMEHRQCRHCGRRRVLYREPNLDHEPATEESKAGQVVKMDRAKAGGPSKKHRLHDDTGAPTKGKGRRSKR